MWNFLKRIFGLSKKKVKTGFVSVKLTSELFSYHPEATLHGFISLIKKDGYAEGQVGIYGDLAKDVRNKIYDLGSNPLEVDYAIDFSNLFILEPRTPNGVGDEPKIVVNNWIIKSNGADGLTTARIPGKPARTNWFELLDDKHTSWEITYQPAK